MSQNEAAHRLATHVRQLLPLLPQDKQDEISTLCKQLTLRDQSAVNVDLFRKHAAIAVPNAERRARPSDVTEYRHRMHISPRDSAFWVPLKVDEPWFADSA